MNWPGAIFSRRKRATPAGPVRYCAPQHTVEWTEEDVLRLRGFLATPVGQKLVAICGAHAQQTALKECAGDRATPQAAGMDALLRFQFNLASDLQLQRISRATGEQVATNQPAGQEESDLAPAEPTHFQ